MLIDLLQNCNGLNKFWFLWSSSKMNPNDRYLNVLYGTLTAEVNITGISRLGGVQDSFKAKLGEAIPVAAALIQLYTADREQLIDNWTLFNSPTEEYNEGGSCVVIGTSLHLPENLARIVKEHCLM
jgi:hypothetical protein